MSQMISHGNELIRICPTNKNKIEYSPNGGRSWVTRSMPTAAYCGFPYTGVLVSMPNCYLPLAIFCTVTFLN